MNRNDIEQRFKQMAVTNHLSFRRDSDGSFRIAGNGFAVKIRSQIEREEGIFVVLRKEPPSNPKFPHGYGLGYLIEFANHGVDRESDIALSVSDDPEIKARLVEKYCLSYLKGEVSDFPEFERYAIERIEKNLTQFPVIKANKWVRPEWT